MGMIEKEGGIPGWVTEMINAKFDTSGGNNRGCFCVDCGGNSISRVEVEEKHGGHRVLQVYRCSWEYGYRIENVWEIRNLLDVSGVCPFKINVGYVFFPKSRKKKVEENVSKMKMRSVRIRGCCVSCGANLCNDAPPDFRFCSILCKLSCPDAQLHYSASSWVNSLMSLLNEVSLAKINRSSTSSSSSSRSKEESGGELGSCFRLKIRPGVGIVTADSTDQKSRQEGQKKRNKRRFSEYMKEEKGDNRKKRSKKAETGARKSDSLSSAQADLTCRKRSRKGVPCRAPFY